MRFPALLLSLAALAPVSAAAQALSVDVDQAMRVSLPRPARDVIIGNPAIVDANVLGIFFWNLEGVIVDANEAFLRMLGCGREDVVSGRVRWTELTPADQRERDEHMLTELRAAGTVQPYETEFLLGDGRRLPVLIGGALLGALGSYIGVRRYVKI